MKTKLTELKQWVNELPASHHDHGRRRRGGLFATAFGSATMCALPVNAQPTPNLSDDARAEARTSSLASAPEDATTYLFSVRPSTGFGAGNVGVAQRVGVAGEYWFSDYVGLGLTGTFVSQEKIFAIDSTASAVAIAPVIAVRSAPRFGYFLATTGMGYAYVRRYDTDGNFCVAQCRPDVLSRRSGFTVNTAVGWLFHPGASQFEIGPVARFDALQTLEGNRRTDYVFTLNLELGFALLTPNRHVQ